MTGDSHIEKESVDRNQLEYADSKNHLAYSMLQNTEKACSGENIPECDRTVKP